MLITATLQKAWLERRYLLQSVTGSCCPAKAGLPSRPKRCSEATDAHVSSIRCRGRQSLQHKTSWNPRYMGPWGSRCPQATLKCCISLAKHSCSRVCDTGLADLQSHSNIGFVQVDALAAPGAQPGSLVCTRDAQATDSVAHRHCLVYECRQHARLPMAGLHALGELLRKQ